MIFVKQKSGNGLSRPPVDGVFFIHPYLKSWEFRATLQRWFLRDNDGYRWCRIRATINSNDYFEEEQKKQFRCLNFSLDQTPADFSGLGKIANTTCSTIAQPAVLRKSIQVLQGSTGWVEKKKQPRDILITFKSRLLKKHQICSEAPGLCSQPEVMLNLQREKFFPSRLTTF